MQAYSRREGAPKPAADPAERRLEDAQGRAALELERVRRLERTGDASPADVQAARADLSAAWEALEAHRKAKRPADRKGAGKAA